ncbi:MAG: BadF/BadG/BcrA/BcrD ATPase family protein [Desulfitobacteriaceae bacterium]
MSVTAGIDVGSSAIKVVLMNNESTVHEIISKEVQRIRRRDVKKAIRDSYENALAKAGLKESDIDYVAATGEVELVDFKQGHFYGMTTHARGAKYFFDDTGTVADIGALHLRAIAIDKDSKVLRYKMTGQCASSSGQFIENIIRYLGLRMDEVSDLALKSQNPQRISSICAVLGETDVINMVSKQVPIEDVMMGILESIAARLVKLLRNLNAESPITFTGGLAASKGMIKAIQTILAEEGMDYKLQTHEDAICAGAIGAAIWSGVRLKKSRLNNVG